MAAHDNLLGSTSFLMAPSDQKNSPLLPNKQLLDDDTFLAETDTLLLSLEADNLHEQISTCITTSPSSTQDQFMDDQKLTGTQVGQMSDERLQHRKALAAKRRFKYQQKLRQERKTLQQQEIDLKSELSSLVQKQKAERKNRAKNWGLAVWSAIAIREKGKRIVAEQKRRQLREAVILHASIFDRLNVELQQQPIEGTVSRSCTDASH